MALGFAIRAGTALTTDARMGRLLGLVDWCDSMVACGLFGVWVLRVGAALEWSSFWR